MKIDSNSLLNTCLEIEGLLCLVSRRGNTVPDNVAQLLVDKASKLKDNLIEFTSHCPEEDEEEVENEEIAQAAFLEETEDAGQQPDEEPVVTSDDCTVNLSAPKSEEETTVEPQYEVKSVDPAPVASTIVTEPAQTVRNDVAPVELTINDKFRFRRELFGNSDVDLADALQIASQMSSIEEIEDYFYNDLCFDPANDTVKDFIRVITSKH